MNITLKNLPEPVYEVIKSEAKRNRRSLNAQIIQTLEKEAAEAQRRLKLSEWCKKADELVANMPMLEDGTPLIREDRDSH